ncbi:hypothetical protein GGR56DRAFT_672195 [Xylariaceae sp. FL0804]|nr:hypothetical protein GGR56DRAFT_672195 [Xylariaceae sp. FL0804]
MIATRQLWRRGAVWAALLTLCLLLYSFFSLPSSSASFGSRRLDFWRPSGAGARRPGGPRPDVPTSLGLDERQCEAAFPGLTHDIDLTVALGPFTLKRARGDDGPLQARIKDGELYILHAGQKGLWTELLQTAALHQIHRALLTAPAPLPDTVFSLNVEDTPHGTAWSYSRPAFAAPSAAGPHIARAFLMPHFSFWGWPLPSVGSLSRAAAAVAAVEEGGGEEEQGGAPSFAFADKDDRVVWRGTKRFNSPHYPHLRQDLLEATRGAAWADVQALDGPAPAPPMMIEDFCRYKYVLYTDGVTYSGRLPFLQMCGSVLLTPPIAWRQHLTHLIRPLFSSDLDLGGYLDPDLDLDGGNNNASAAATAGDDTGSTWTPSANIDKGWPAHYAPSSANAVFVAPDWSDLGAAVRWLDDHPDVAEGIARRQRELFVGGGYLGPAAEACYWRALIRGWSSVVRLDDDGEGWDDDELGESWELYAMRPGMPQE